MDCIGKKNDDLKTLKEEGLAYIEEHLKPSRYEHTLRVRDESIRLAERFGGDREKAEVAAIFHDMAKNLPPEEMDALVREFHLGERYLNHPNLAHSKLAACLMRRDFGVTDPELLNAVASHTTGRAGMETVEKIVFLADAIEPGRNYPSVEDIRALAAVDLDEACVLLLELTIEYLERKGTEVDSDTIDALEYMRSVVETKESKVYKKESEKCGMSEAKELAMQIAEALCDKKARDVLLIDIGEKSSFADYFVMASAGSERQLEALKDAVEDLLEPMEIFPKSVEGKRDSGWILMDYGDVIVNMLTLDMRDKYNIEKIWGDCEVVAVG